MLNGIFEHTVPLFHRTERTTPLPCASSPMPNRREHTNFALRYHLARRSFRPGTASKEQIWLVTGLKVKNCCLLR